MTLSRDVAAHLRKGLEEQIEAVDRDIAAAGSTSSGSASAVQQGEELRRCDETRAFLVKALAEVDACTE